jgi:CsoR family transcriptional regulator, copper-sensing transcriptional repressor
MTTANQHGYIHNKDDYLKRLRRIEGQARVRLMRLD